MKHREQLLVGGGVLVAALGLAVGAVGIPSAAGYAGVGPNFLPWVVAVLLLACGGWLVWEAASGGFRHREEPSGAERPDLPGFVWVSAGILLNALLIDALGFILSCTLCFVLAVRGFHWSEGRLDLRPARWLRDILIGLAISAPVYWMFTQVLGVSLPGLTATGWL